MAVVIIVAVAASLCLVVAVLGCLNCFMKRKSGFSPFSNPDFVEEGTAGRCNDAFVVDMESRTQSNGSHINFDPLPDITPKSVSLTPLRPKIVFIHEDDAALSLLGSYRPFQRKHLTYLNPLGTGWFGQAINSEALGITSSLMKCEVVVKILKDDASKLEEKQFIEEIIPFRRLKHPHVMSLLGQCTETKPYLAILEYAAHGNLKDFLQSHNQSIDALMRKNGLLQFCLDAAAGVACIHEHDFVHCDLATRNCLVMSDYTIKVGDYGIADHLYKEDYLQSNKELLPIRWMAPECLVVKEGTICSSGKYSKASDMWSFGVFIWEVFSMAERPYDIMTDEAVLQRVYIDREITLAEIPHRVPFHDRLSVLMNECFKEPNKRISIGEALHDLEVMSCEKVETVNNGLGFEQKWSHLTPNTQSRSQGLISENGSVVAESFSSKIPFMADNRVASTITDPGDKGSEEIPNGHASQPRAASPTKDNSANTDNPVQMATKEIPNFLADIDSQHVLTELPKLALEDEIIDSNVNSSHTPRGATMPRDNSENTDMPTQMATSTPLANKTVQNKTSTSSLLPCVADQDGLRGDSGLLDFGSSGQNHQPQKLVSLEENTVHEPESNQFEALCGDGMLGSDQNAGLFSDSVVHKPEENDIPKTEEFKRNGGEKSEEKTYADNRNNFDFLDFGINTNKSSDFGLEATVEPVLSEKIDTSFEVPLPSVLSPDENISTASQPQTSSSLLASPDFLVDSGDDIQMSNNDNLQSADTITPSQPFPSTVVANVSTSCSILEKYVTPDEAVRAAASGAGELAKDATNDNLYLENNVSSSPSPLSPNNPFFVVDTTFSSSQDAIVMNKSESEINASSSLNSSLVGWDTSIPDSNINQSSQPDLDQSGFTQINHSSDSLSFLEKAELSSKSSMVSSDISFLDGPAVSDSRTEPGETARAVQDIANTDSLASGFDSTPVPFLSLSQNVELSPAPELSSPLGVAMVPEVATNITMETKPQTTVSSNSNPFNNFLSETKSSSPSLDQNPTAMENDIILSGLNEGGKVADRKNESSPFDLLGLDPFSGSAALTSSATNTTQRTSYQSDDESGINCHSVTESMTIPIAIHDSCYVSVADSQSAEEHSKVIIDSCYTSVTDSQNAEATSEEQSKAFLDNTNVRLNLSLMESDSNGGNLGDLLGDEESLRNKVWDRLMGDESITDVEEENSGRKSSPDDSDYNSSNDDTSSNSDSEREYICVNPFDTGQPPTFDFDSDNENLEPDSPDEKDLSFEDLNEQDLKIVSEIYLSRGVKSSRVFEAPLLETIPEHQPLHCVSREVILTPSETSSIGPRDDDIFSSDSYEYEWDDFYSDPLIFKDDAGLGVGLPHSSIGDHNISNWSVDFDTDSQHSNASSVLSTTLLNSSDSADTGSKDNYKSSISDQKVQCLSDSESLSFKDSSKTTPRPSLVASILAKQNNSRFSSPVKGPRDKGGFYSLMEDFDFQFDSSQEDSISPVSLGVHDEDSSSPVSLGVHDEDKDIIYDLDNKSQPHNSPVSPSSFFPSSFSFQPSLPQPSSPHTYLSSETSDQDLSVDQVITTKQMPSLPDANAVSSSTDCLGFESLNKNSVPDG